MLFIEKNGLHISNLSLTMWHNNLAYEFSV